MKNKYQTLIRTSWVVLIICFFIKILGFNIFDISSDNQRFISFCNFIENNKIAYFLSSLLTYVSSSTLVLFAMLKINKTAKKFKLILLITIFSLIIARVLKFLLTPIFEPFYFIIDYTITLILPIIKKPKLWKRIIIGNLLVLAFQFVSMMAKGINLPKGLETNVVINLIYMIDYYIMILLYYLYSNERRTQI